MSVVFSRYMRFIIIPTLFLSSVTPLSCSVDDLSAVQVARTIAVVNEMIGMFHKLFNPHSAEPAASTTVQQAVEIITGNGIPAPYINTCA